ncbi:MAG: isocitrate lyase/PEP mutase family protein [Streptosporangiales bacterium]
MTLTERDSVHETLNRRLRERVGRPADPLLLPGAPNALTARVLEEAGFEAVYVSGAGVTNSFLGAPDVGLLGLSEIAAHVAAMREAVDVPLVVDADTGFGNALNVQRTIRELERAGANAVQLEDQVTPKRCGHFAGKSVIDAGEMTGKVRAAVDARTDDDLLVIARTDARAELGLAEACDRANRYVEAGADAAFVEAPRDRDELALIPRKVPGPHVVNMVEGGLTPILPLSELGELGFTIVLYANTAMRAAIAGMKKAAADLRRQGDSLALSVDIASWEERQDLVRKGTYDERAERYGGNR